ncbi:hypothetical protein [Pseudomonas syringae group genomosp. 3]|nr:hypothetical protein [Pseudomonas syringae group genomosp. 3]
MFLLFRLRVFRAVCVALFVLNVPLATVRADGRPETWQVVVDAGSSKTRGILYRLSADTVTPVVEYSSKLPLASYARVPDDSGNLLIAPLLDALERLAADKKYALEKNTVLVNVLGTAGMRELSAGQQDAIYKAVNTSILAKGWALGQVGTIDGRDEGIFAWVHLNFLKGLATSDNTLGIIEMGGASSQITFALKSPSADETDVSKNARTVTWNGKTYSVVSESLLGLGADAARTSMNKIKQQDQRCYPEGAPVMKVPTTGAFDFAACDRAYDDAIAAHYQSEINKLIPIVKSSDYAQTDFIGLSSLYYTLNFFNNDMPDREKLKSALEQSCKRYADIEESLRQDDLKDKYQPENKCANGVFVYDLLYDYLQLGNGRLTALKKVENMDIRWTDGFLLLGKQAP